MDVVDGMDCAAIHRSEWTELASTVSTLSTWRSATDREPGGFGVGSSGKGGLGEEIQNGGSDGIRTRDLCRDRAAF